MVYATLGIQVSPPEHVHPATAHAADLPYPAVGWFLAGMFLLDAVVVVVRPPDERPQAWRDLVVTVFPHLAMDIAMVAMLVTALIPLG